MLTNCISQYAAVKSTSSLFYATKAYKEMINLLSIMSVSSDESELIMSLGLQHHLYFAPETKDKAHSLMSIWKPGCNEKEHLCNLVELVHATLKLLDIGRRRWMKEKSAWESKSRKEMSLTDKYKESAANYNVEGYIGKLISCGAVKAYTYLLAEHALNAPEANHHVVSFFTRVCKLKTDVEKINFESLKEGDCNGDGGKESDAPPPTTYVTLEPLLFTYPLLNIYDSALSQSPPSCPELTRFSKTIVRHFADCAKRNPVIAVECLFPCGMRFKRYCEMVSNAYVHESDLGRGGGGGGGGAAIDEPQDYQGGGQGDGGGDGNRSEEEDEEDEWDEDAGEPEVLAIDEELVESGSDGGSDDEDADGAKEERRRKRKEERRAAKEKRRRVKRWSSEEDAVIRSKYFLHSGDRGRAAEEAAKEPNMIEGGKGIERIKRRARELGIGEEEGEEGKGGGGSGAAAANSSAGAARIGAASEGEDRWSDRRKFVGKRDRSAIIERGEGKDFTGNNARRRLERKDGDARGKGDDDDDDDDDDVEFGEAGGGNDARFNEDSFFRDGGKRNAFLGDDDDDD